jgi:hypothetical protein
MKLYLAFGDVNFKYKDNTVADYFYKYSFNLEFD